MMVTNMTSPFNKAHFIMAILATTINIPLYVVHTIVLYNRNSSVALI